MRKALSTLALVAVMVGGSTVVAHAASNDGFRFGTAPAAEGFRF